MSRDNPVAIEGAHSAGAPQQKPVLLLDCDGVLLSWVANIPHFLTSIGRCANHLEPIRGGNMFTPLRQLFPARTEVDSTRLFEGYQNSNFIAELPVFEPASESIVREISRSFDLIVITNIGDQPARKFNRISNLVAVFGDIFTDIICQPVGASKKDAILSIAKTRQVALWIDDVVGHVQTGIAAGVPSAQYTYGMTDGRNRGEVPEFESWADIKRYLDYSLEKGAKIKTQRAVYPQAI